MMEWDIKLARFGLTVATIEYNEHQLKVVYRDECSDIIIKEMGEVVRHVTYLGKFKDALERAFEVEEEFRKENNPR